MIYTFEQKPALEDLVQFGVKGMKWGVRKDRSGSDSSGRQERKTERKAARQEKKAGRLEDAAKERDAVSASEKDFTDRMRAGKLTIAERLLVVGSFTIDDIANAQSLSRRAVTNAYADRLDQDRAAYDTQTQQIRDRAAGRRANAARIRSGKSIANRTLASSGNVRVP